MNKSIVTIEELDEMKAVVLERLKFAKSVGAKTKQLEKQYMILLLAQVGLSTEL
jgi:hypothetical protein